MPVKYKVIEKGQPGVAGGGIKKFYANTISNGEADIDKLTTAIEKVSTVSGADIRAVLYALVDTIPELLGEGRIVRVGDLGDFQVSISSNGFDSKEEVNGSAVRSSKILFRPGKKLRNMLQNLEYEKVS